LASSEALGKPGLTAHVDARQDLTTRNAPNGAREEVAHVGVEEGEDKSARAAGARRSPRLRQRVAWMYYVEEMTQSAIADALGIGRITVVRLLAEARSMNDVRISLSREISDLAGLEIETQKRFGVGEVVVAPLSEPGGDTRAVIAAAAGDYVSRLLRPDMKIGLGWGETLSRMLGFLDERTVPRLSVVSLLGGVMRARAANPAECAWQFSRVYMAECFMLAAPAIVDSRETKRALIERCGLGEVFELARALDAVVVGVGGASSFAAARSYGLVSDSEVLELQAQGAIGNLLYNFFDCEGCPVDHSVNARVMSIPLDSLRKASTRVMVAGGADKVDAIVAACRLLQPTALITDEATAKGMVSSGR
jgi:DNA-binding transcriptional regulator LsrR (DeoR family)